MAKFLVLGRYASEGAKNFMKEGAVASEAKLRKLIESFDGRLEARYLTSGRYSGVLIVEADTITSVVAQMGQTAAGVIAEFDIFPLFTSAEVDKAMGKIVAADAAA